MKSSDKTIRNNMDNNGEQRIAQRWHLRLQGWSTLHLAKTQPWNLPKATQGAVGQSSILTEDQLSALEWEREEKEAHGEIETRNRTSGLFGCSRYLLCRQYQRHGAHLPTNLHRYLQQVSHRQTPPAKYTITSADVLNDSMIPLFESHGIRLLCILTDRGSEYCGNWEAV